MKPLLSLVFVYFILVIPDLDAQALLPYTFENNSEYEDDEIFVGLVGKYLDDEDVWMDMNTSTLMPMSAADNTIDGPEWSTPASWKYADIFEPLSTIENKTIQIPHGLYGCRIFIAFESPMYLHFHEGGGYAGANLNAPTDPNDGIRWELVELTWANAGLWTNTSRVDAYQYPMGLEVSGFTGAFVGDGYANAYANAIHGGGTPMFGKIGELLSHSEILDRWDQTVSDPYLVSKFIKTHAIDGMPIIKQPSKVATFPRDILKDYIDEIWTTYIDKELIINIGDRGTWRGTVSGSQFNFIDPEDGSIASIYNKPTSFDVIEGAGALAYTPESAGVNQEKYSEDLMIQAQMSAAITRHAIYTDQSAPEVQYTHDASRFFVREPYNEYVSFFHNDQISYESQTYAFAYDDVGEHSSTIQSAFPTQVRVIIGGYHGYENPPSVLTLITLSPNVDVIGNGSTMQFTAQGYDQYMASYPTQITWSTSGGGTIDNDGLFRATTDGTYTITAQDGAVSRSLTIRVDSDSDVPVLTGCVSGPSHNEYNYMVSEASQNPTITFVPTQSGTGDALCLLFYGTDPDGIYGARSVTPNMPYQITASAGTTVYFYYTYNLPNGNENSTSGERHSFVVGQCHTLGPDNTPQGSPDFALHPNPVTGGTLFLSGLPTAANIQVYNLQGQLLDRYETTSGQETLEIATSQLHKGLYLLSIRSLDDQIQKSYRFFVD